MADQGSIWLFGCRSKSVGAGLAYGLQTVLLRLWHKSAAAGVACCAIEVLDAFAFGMFINNSPFRLGSSRPSPHSCSAIQPFKLVKSACLFHILYALLGQFQQATDRWATWNLLIGKMKQNVVGINDVRSFVLVNCYVLVTDSTRVANLLRIQLHTHSQFSLENVNTDKRFVNFIIYLLSLWYLEIWRAENMKFKSKVGTARSSILHRQKHSSCILKRNWIGVWWWTSLEQIWRLAQVTEVPV